MLKAMKTAEGLVSQAGTTSATLFAKNAGRVYLAITNTHASQTIYVRFGDSAATAALGRPIAAGATLEYGLHMGPNPAEAVQVLGSGAATTLYAIEGTGVPLS